MSRKFGYRVAATAASLATIASSFAAGAFRERIGDTPPIARSEQALGYTAVERIVGIDHTETDPNAVLMAVSLGCAACTGAISAYFFSKARQESEQ